MFKVRLLEPFELMQLMGWCFVTDYTGPAYPPSPRTLTSLAGNAFSGYACSATFIVAISMLGCSQVNRDFNQYAKPDVAKVCEAEKGDEQPDSSSSSSSSTDSSDSD